MDSELIIACVKWGNRFHSHYANMLYEMVRRNLSQKFTFVCFTNNPSGLDENIKTHALPKGLDGWWNKLYMFKEGVFKPGQRVIYFDLDTLITGNLDEISNYNGGLALLRDFYRPDGYGSGVMMWQGGTNHHIWLSYEMAGRPLLEGGDQAWIENAEPNAAPLQDLFPQKFVSFKTGCKPFPPESASVVCFHGEPKQDNCEALWVRDIWQKNAAVINRKATIITLADEKLANIQHAKSLNNKWLETAPEHDGVAVIIGGGASLSSNLSEIAAHKKQGHKVFAVNNAAHYLETKNIDYDAAIIADAEVKITLPSKPSYCSAASHAKMFTGESIIWSPEIVGGNTTGLSAVRLAYMLGYRNFHLYGFDSCYAGEKHHAYAQPQSDKYRIFKFDVFGHELDAAQWMVDQASEFVILADELMKSGCQLSVNGEGLIPLMAEQIAISQADNELIAEVNSMLGKRELAKVIKLLQNLKNISPAFSKHMVEVAINLRAQNHKNEAQEILDIAAKYNPANLELLHQSAYGFQMMGEFDEAKYYYQQALKLKPDYIFSQLALGQLQMMETKFAQGRETYELRFAANNKTDGFNWLEIPLPRWHGEDIADKKIFFWAEQGIGDIIMFAGFLPYLLAQRPQQISLAVPDKLITLMQRSFPEIKVESLADARDYTLKPQVKDVLASLPPLQKAFEKPESIKAFNYAAPMGDMLVNCLPQYEPRSKAYLKADPAKIAEIKTGLDKLPGRKIGISWYTSNLKDSLARSIPLENWREILATPGCQIFSLQHHVAESEIKTHNINIYPGIDPAEDIESLAALTSCMDAVITIDNTNAHLAGALGVPTILLLPKGHNFRWPLLGNGTIWYQNIAVLRQQKFGEWDTVMQSITNHLSSNNRQA